MPSCCFSPGPVPGASASCEPQVELGSLACTLGSCSSQRLGDEPRMLEAVGVDFKTRAPEAQSLCSVNDTMLGPLPRGGGGPCDTPTPHRGMDLVPVQGSRPDSSTPAFPTALRLWRPEPSQAHKVPPWEQPAAPPFLFLILSHAGSTGTRWQG